MMSGGIEKFLVVAAAMAVVYLGNGAVAEPQIPCYYVFGDSLLENGNNNNIITLAKANYLPYGIDFPGGPTGRFSNGKTTVDVLGKFQTIFSLFFHLSISGLS